MPLPHLDESYKKVALNNMEEQSKKFTQSFIQSGDRAIVIVATCVLDYLLERLLRAFYIKDPTVNSIFKNDHVLQSFYSKINIAYFSGLIPKFIYHDLKIIGEIRNKFAHEVSVNLTFNNKIITQRINKCETRPTTIRNVHARFTIITQLLMDHLCFYEQLLLQSQLKNIVDSFNLDDRTSRFTAITKNELENFIQKKRK